jgi:hypothetical protein
VTTSLIHVAFGRSAAGSLSQALQLLGRDERVICEPDDLSYGPIDPHDLVRRAEFYGDELGYEADLSLPLLIAAFWHEATTTTSTPVAWLSRRCAREYAGFLEFLSRRDEPPLVVDVAGVAFVGRDGAPSPHTSNAVGYVRADQLIAHGLFDAAPRISDVEFQRERARWQTLKRENAALRVLDTTGLVSAPITFFDELILSCVTDDWQSCARVVGDAMYRSSSEFYQTGDLVLWSRVRALVEDGVLEGRGEMVEMRYSSVRRPSP